ncbi:Hypothetical protein POVR2_LOCUS202 [uncultured virus]|nr:Hypothetical protein POVR2_LOCUS202 [uncultured virus]
MSVKVKTEYHRALLPAEIATSAYIQLRDTVYWQEGVRSKQGFTRLARGFSPGENTTVDELVCLTLHKLALDVKLVGIYVNYYKNGEHWTPNHTHPGTKQIIISLGATRTLSVGKEEYEMGNGDVAIFGSAIHGIKKQSEVMTGRISIALLALKV